MKEPSCSDIYPFLGKQGNKTMLIFTKKSSTMSAAIKPFLLKRNKINLKRATTASQKMPMN